MIVDDATSIKGRKQRSFGFCAAAEDNLTVASKSTKTKDPVFNRLSRSMFSNEMLRLQVTMHMLAPSKTHRLGGDSLPTAEIP